MAWVKDSRFKDTYEYKGVKGKYTRPRRSVYVAGISNGKNIYQVWEMQDKYKGKPSLFTYQGYKTKKSKLFNSRKDAIEYATKREPQKL